MMPAVAPRHHAAEAPRATEPATRSIPFDHVFDFDLTGEIDKTLRTTVTVGVDASFTAVSIGYGVVPELTRVAFGPQPAPPILLAIPALLARVPGVPAGFATSVLALLTPPPPPSSPLTASPQVALRDITLGDLFPGLQNAIGNAPNAPKDMPALEAALRNGIRLNPRLARAALANDGRGVLDASLLRQVFEVVSAPSADVQFLYALFDEGSGREFQSEPILNIAGLGAADGKRPFRYFAQPITFAPLATIRLDITQKSLFRGKLQVCLHGYKVLGGTPAAPQRERPRRFSR